MIARPEWPTVAVMSELQKESAKLMKLGLRLYGLATALRHEADQHPHPAARTLILQAAAKADESSRVSRAYGEAAAVARSWLDPLDRESALTRAIANRAALLKVYGRQLEVLHRFTAIGDEWNAHRRPKAPVTDIAAARR